MSINALVWGENIHQQQNETVRSIYPEGMHATIARALNEDSGISAATAVLQQPEHGLSEEVLARTDVLVWWGHKAHRQVEDEIVERVARRVWGGDGHYPAAFGPFLKNLQATYGYALRVKWREAGERERLWVVNPRHPIAAGLPDHFELEHEEMYGEPFSVPEPLETVFISWFQGGEVFRSGLTYRRGAGNIFYFRPGHETYPTYHDPIVAQVLRNAVRWAHNPASAYTAVHTAPNVPAHAAPEPLVERGPKLHAPGEEGYK